MTTHEHPAKSAQEKRPAPGDIAKKAYALSRQEGRKQGHDVENWLEAEAEMVHAGPDR